LGTAALLTLNRGDLDAAQSFAEQTIEAAARVDERERLLADDFSGRVRLLLFNIFLARGDLASAESVLDEARRILEPDTHPWGAAMAMCFAGQLAIDRGDLAQAVQDAETAQSLYDRLDDKMGMAAARNILGSAWILAGDYDQARAPLSESEELSRSINYTEGLFNSLTRQALVAQEDGDYESARRLYADGLDICWQTGHMSGFTNCLEGLSEVAVAQADPSMAVLLLGAAEELRSQKGFALPDWAATRHERLIEVLREQATPYVYEKLRRNGASMPHDQLARLCTDVG
jgi:tetratricopeptide (TPR) repeat protein